VTPVETWLNGRPQRTREAYASDLEDFRRFLGADDGNAAAAALLSRGAGAANELVLAYRSHLLGRGLSTNTVNRRLATLRSFDGRIAARNVKGDLRRYTRGPSEAGIRGILAELQARPGDKGVRDRAMFRLLLDLGLRRFEVTGLDVEHLDLPGSRVAVLRKGKKERRWMELPPQTVAALAAWLEVRGTRPGPLFTGFARGKGLRLKGDGLYRMVRDLGRAAGVAEVRPHKIRHSHITAALQETGGDIHAVAAAVGVLPHTVSVYCDPAAYPDGTVATRVARRFDAKPVPTPDPK
jgi:integrase/recombinase XerC